MTTTELQQLRRAAEQYGSASTLADNTRDSYRSAWLTFTTWAWPGEDSWPLPADPAVVAGFLMHRAEQGMKASTIARDYAAIGYLHRKHGLANPCEDPLVRNVMARLRRDLAIEDRAEPKQATGLTEEHLERIRATACEPRGAGGNGTMEAPRRAYRRGLMEIATASLMRDAMLRRSEAVRIRWEDVSVQPDGAGVLTVRRSKTSLLATQVPLRRATVRDLWAVRPKHPEPTDRVLRVRSTRAISNRIKSAAKYAGFGDGFSGHSPRVGMAQDLAAAGASTAEIAIAGRWKSPAMVVRYSRHVAGPRSAVLKYLG